MLRPGVNYTGSTFDLFIKTNQEILTFLSAVIWFIVNDSYPKLLKKKFLNIQILLYLHYNYYMLESLCVSYITDNLSQIEI